MSYFQPIALCLFQTRADGYVSNLTVVILKLRLVSVSGGSETLITGFFHIWWELQFSLCSGFDTALVVVIASSTMWCSTIVWLNIFELARCGLVWVGLKGLLIFLWFTSQGILVRAFVYIWRSKHLVFFKRWVWFFKFVSSSFRMLAAFCILFFCNLVSSLELGLLDCALCVSFCFVLGYLLDFCAVCFPLYTTFDSLCCIPLLRLICGCWVRFMCPPQFYVLLFSYIIFSLA